MAALLEAPAQEDQVAELATQTLGVRPARIERQSLTSSGNTVHRLYLADGSSLVLRISDQPNTFAFTKLNLDVLRALGLPVQSVFASGGTLAGGSFIILDWLPGRDLQHELPQMTVSQLSRLAGQVVECQRRVGSLPAARGFGWAPIGKTPALPRWSDIFGQPAEPAVLDDGTPLGRFRARLGRVRQGLECYFSTVAARPFLDDLTIKNVLVEAGEFTGIIDLDFVCYGDPLLSVGATIAFLVADVGGQGEFYGRELLRFWNPGSGGLRATHFYTANWAVGFLSAALAAGDSDRVKKLSIVTDEILCRAEE